MVCKGYSFKRGNNFISKSVKFLILNWNLVEPSLIIDPQSKNSLILSKSRRSLLCWVRLNLNWTWIPKRIVEFLNKSTEKQPSPSINPTNHAGCSIFIILLIYIITNLSMLKTTFKLKINLEIIKYGSIKF